MIRSPKMSRRKLSSLFDFQQLEHRNLLAGDVICTGDLDNVIIVRVSSADPEFIEIEVDGVIEGTFDSSASGVISINAELGNDIFLVDYSNGAPINADGFRFVGGGGVDRLESNNELENFFVFEQQVDSEGSLGDFVRFEDIEELVGGAGQDRFDIRSIEGDVRVDGLGGNDVFRLGTTVPDFFNGVLTELNGNVSIEGDAGQNRILVGGRGSDGLTLSIHDSFIAGHNGDFEIGFTSEGGSFTNADGTIGGVTVFGSNSQTSPDFIVVESFLGSDSLKIRTSAGPDEITVTASAAGPVILDGGVGQDTANIHFQGFGNRAAFFEVATFTSITAFATDSDDILEVDSQFARLGNERLQLNTAFVIRGLDGNDQFLLDYEERISVFGGNGNDTFFTTPGAGLIDAFGEAGDDVFDFTAGVRGGVFQGGAGNDRFFGLLDRNARFEGGTGSDEYVFDVERGLFADVVEAEAVPGDVDSFVINTVQPAALYRLFQSGLRIGSGSFVSGVSYSGLESVTLNTDDTDDQVVFVGTDTPSNLEFFVNTFGGNDEIQFGDRFNFRSSPFANTEVTVDAGEGFNQLDFDNVESDSGVVVIDADVTETVPVTTIRSGVDNAYIVVAKATGGVFADANAERGGIVLPNFFPFAIGRVVEVNGLPEDVVLEFVGSTGVVNISEHAFGDIILGSAFEATFNITESGTDRVIDLRPTQQAIDSGYVVNILGTDSDDFFELSNGRFDWGTEERVLFNESARFVNIIGNAGDDEVSIRATLENVRLRVLGGEGNDTFRVGGNLNAIDGSVEVYGGAGNDSLLIDDSLATSPYSYQIDRNRIVTIPGPFAAERPDFAGVVFGNAQIENLTLSGSSGANLVRVRPSVTTDINLVGNAGADAVSLISEPFDGHLLELDDPTRGRWTFDHGYRDLVFEEFDIQHES